MDSSGTPLIRLNRSERRRLATLARGKGGWGWRQKKQRIGESRARKARLA